MNPAKARKLSVSLPAKFKIICVKSYIITGRGLQRGRYGSGLLARFTRARGGQGSCQLATNHQNRFTPARGGSGFRLFAGLALGFGFAGGFVPNRFALGFGSLLQRDKMRFGWLFF